MLANRTDAAWALCAAAVILSAAPALADGCGGPSNTPCILALAPGITPKLGKGRIISSSRSGAFFNNVVSADAFGDVRGCSADGTWSFYKLSSGNSFGTANAEGGGTLCVSASPGGPWLTDGKGFHNDGHGSIYFKCC